MPDASDPDPLLDLLGERVEAAELRLDRAQRLAGFLQARDDVGARLVEARRRDDVEWLILSVDVDVGQAPAADIRHEEQIAVGFRPADRAWPHTLALREDFPDDVTHLFMRVEGDPVALCLSEEAWAEARLRWSPGSFIRLLRMWLIDTARGALHRDEQAVEQFIAVSSTRVILPGDLFDEGRIGKPLFGMGLGQEGVGPPIYAFDFEPKDPTAVAAVAATLIGVPQVQGAVQRPPRTLADLLALFGGDDPALGEAFDGYVRAWLQQPNLREAMPLVVVQVPMLRGEGEEPERRDLWAFILDATVVEVGIALDLWSSEGEGPGEVYAFNRRPGPYGEAIRVIAADLHSELIPRHAAEYNGLDGPSGKSIVAIGAGALGSQVIANLTRMGESISAIADEDRLMPHNLARHAIWDRELLGWAKARALALMVVRMRSGAPAPAALVLDVTDAHADNAEQLLAAIRASDAILDMAASVAVSRRLAIDEDGGGRRIAAFLSPTGFDLVILAEDGARTSRLDHLEMALYAAVLADADLDGHFAVAAGRRYARGCREVSARLAQTAVALHAAVAAEQVRNLLDGDEPMAGVWRLDRKTMTVRHVALDTRPMRSFDAGGWTVLISHGLLETLGAQRQAKLPVETGGVLLGTFDADRRMIYVVAHIPCPADSIERPDSFIRGAFGMAEAAQAAEDATLSMLRYVGEWHSHPDGFAAHPSHDDVALYLHMAEGMQVEGHPPVMIIMGEDEVGVVTSFEDVKPIAAR